jgi:hypothetical protein
VEVQWRHSGGTVEAQWRSLSCCREFDSGAPFSTCF